jgi:hypothetical protein
VNGLVIRSPWIDLILDGKKIWEIRGRRTHIRGKIGLIRGGSGTIVGVCNLIGIVGPLNLKQFRKDARKAGLRKSETKTLPYKTTYAWLLENPKRLKRIWSAACEPIPFRLTDGVMSRNSVEKDTGLGS